MDSEDTANTEEPIDLDAEHDADVEDAAVAESDDAVDEDVVDIEDEPSYSPSGAGNTAATTDLEELVRYVAGKLVQNSDDITVASELRAGTVYVSLRVPEEEMGRVIGREGRTAKAIRTLVSIAGSRHNVHARLDIDG